MPRILDNGENDLATALRQSLEQGVAFDACVGYLNLRGWNAVGPAVNALVPPEGRPPARILVGMAARPEALMRSRYRVRREGTVDRVTLGDVPSLRDAALRDFRTQLTVGIPTDDQERALRALRDQLLGGRVEVKFFARYPLHAKLYLTHLQDGQVIPRLGFVGSSNLTLAGLRAQGELNVDVTDEDATSKLLSWFQDRWNDDLAVDVTSELAEILNESWIRDSQPRPYLLYLKMAFELSRDAREGLRDYDLPANLRDVLLDHQASAVQVAARIVERRGGVMIGDVVGLGKTLIATALARLMYEHHNMDVLVICPRNLVSMWTEYLHEYDVRGHVVSLSMVHKDLAELRRFRLVIIDESHNLRTVGTRQWTAVRDYIDRNDPRVVLLTATPYNKDFRDAAGQLRLWVGDDADLGVRPERLISDVGELELGRRTDGRLSTLAAFEQSEEGEDWQRLMSLFLVRRTRRFVEKQYGEVGPDGRAFLRFADGDPFYFPERIPVPLEYKGGPDDPGERLASDQTVDVINTLGLPRYRLSDFLEHGRRTLTPDETQIVESLAKGRANLLGFTRTQLLKRMTSCGHSFLLSVDRHMFRNAVLLHALIEGLPVPIGSTDRRGWDEESDGEETLFGAGRREGGTPSPDLAGRAAKAYAELLEHPPAKLRWLPHELFGDELADELRQDQEILEGLRLQHEPWDPAKDSKLDALARLIRETHPDEKVLIFSEYADTAAYVASQLSPRLPDEEVGLATGDTDDPTRVARRFSPRSNSAIGGLPRGTSELRVLVATDVLSEGQNLQDAAIVVNYDLPWTIIKLIQRAGRVDRVGQMSPIVRVYSPVAQDGVERVIELHKRIRRRLRENAEVFGSDERFFDDDMSEEDLAGLFDGTASLADPDADEDVDWSSQALAIWEAASDDDREQAMLLPDVVSSTRPRRSNDEAGGVLVYTRSTRGLDGLAWASPASSDVRVMTPIEALHMAQVDPAAPPPDRRQDHNALVAAAVSGALIETLDQHRSVTHSGPRRRLYRLLTGFLDDRAGTLFDTPELRSAAEHVLQRPLTEAATHRFSKAWRAGDVDPEQLVALAVDLHERGELTVDVETADDDVHIVCSIGVPTP